MTEEEKTLKYLSAMRVIDFNKLGFVCGKETITDALNLIQKQQTDSEKKDKIIDLMSYVMIHEEIPQKEYCIWRDMSCELLGGNKECKKCIKQYFEKQVESESKK